MMETKEKSQKVKMFDYKIHLLMQGFADRVEEKFDQGQK